MAATIYEVARKAGFSIGTVSRVLNGIPLHTEETRMKVLRAMDELNYQPNAMAQGLARRKSSTFEVEAHTNNRKAEYESTSFE